MRTRILLMAAAPLTLWAHGFDERHDLPAPLTHFMLGAALAVALSFVLAVLFARAAPALIRGNQDGSGARFHLPAALRLTLRLGSLLLFAVTVAAALLGTADPMMNLAPTLVWIVWWVGLSLLVACVGDIWPLLDPWAALFEGADAVARRLGLRTGIARQRRWPPALGVWPAVVLLLAWSWLEIVFPLAAVPWRVGCAALAWTGVTLLGMACFGRESWQRHGDVFAIYFALLGRMAPVAWDVDCESAVLRPPGSALAVPADGRQLPAGGVGFVLAMLSTVLFDGLHASRAWPWFEGVLARVLPYGTALSPLVAGTAGLVLVWMAFLLAYGFTCWITAQAGPAGASSVARSFAPTLVPIAVGYNVAHNFSALVEQGQNMVYLLSDPFGRHWDLFGTAGLPTRSGLVDARMTWYVAIGMVVAGHCIGVWLAHRVALRDHPRPVDALRFALPLVLLMLAYTAISLFVIADPMVRYRPPPH